MTRWMSLPGPEPGLLTNSFNARTWDGFSLRNTKPRPRKPKCWPISQKHLKLTLILCHPYWSHSGRTPYRRSPQSCRRPPFSRWCNEQGHGHAFGNQHDDCEWWCAKCESIQAPSKLHPRRYMRTEYSDVILDTRFNLLITHFDSAIPNHSRTRQMWVKF